MRVVLCVVAGCAVGALTLRGTLGNADSAAGEPASQHVSTPAVGQAVGRVPSAFVPNVGQWEHPARYVARFGAMTVFLQADGWWVQLAAQGASQPDRRDAGRERRQGDGPHGAALRMSFAGACTPRLVEGRALAGVHNYFLGNDPDRWRTGVPRLDSVLYRGLYCGVDVRAYEKDGHFEYDLLLNAGAELSQVDVRVDGADELRIDADGALVLGTPVGAVRQPTPLAWIIDAEGRRHPIACEYELRERNRFGFVAHGWDGTSELVLDPGLLYSTFLGGNGLDRIRDLQVDAAGVVTVAGFTDSSDFPTTPGAWDRTLNGRDACVARLDPRLPAAQQLVYATFLGGQEWDEALDLAVSDAGVVTLCGITSHYTFPTTTGAWSRTLRGLSDAFVARLDPRITGAGQLAYSTFFGGTDQEEATAISVASSGIVTVAGSTGSFDLPTTAGAWRTSRASGGRTSFIARLDPTLTGAQQLTYGTYFGGSSFEETWALHVASSGVVTIAGRTHSPDFPTTPGAWDSTLGGITDGFVARLDPSRVGAQQLIYATLFGGSRSDYIWAMVVDPSGVISFVGDGDSPDVPVTSNAWNPSPIGGPGFFVRLDPSQVGAAQLLYSTRVDAGCADLVVDDAGVVTICGSPGPGFPTTPGAWDRTFNGVSDCILFRLDPSKPPLEQLLYSTFLGGSDIDSPGSLAVGSDGRVTLVGETRSYDFPTTAGAWDRSFNSGWNIPQDAFATRLELILPTRASFTEFGTGCAGTAGVPRLSAVQLPVLGSTFEVRVANLNPFSFALLLVGVSNRAWGGLTLPVELSVIGMPTCRLYVSGDVSLPLFNTTGSTTWSAPVPNEIELMGGRLFLQAFPFDAPVNLRGVVASNAGEAILGV